MPLLHAAVGMVAGCGLLGHPGPQYLPLLHTETQSHVHGRTGAETGEGSGVTALGLGYGTRDIDVGLSGARDFIVHSEKEDIP